MAGEGVLQSAEASRLEATLAAGGIPDEGELARALRSPACPASLVEALAAGRWVLTARRVLPLLLRHPRCPRPFALDAVGRLGWHDLLQVARDPRAAPPVRRQAERKLLERLNQLALGERAALARLAPRAVIPALLGSPEQAVISALLENPQFTETDALRLIAGNRDANAVAAVVRHHRWGASTTVLEAAARSATLPLPLALGALARLPDAVVGAIAAAATESRMREAARDLLSHRSADGRPAPCARRRGPYTYRE